MKRIGIIYATVDGQTKKIAHRLYHILEDQGFQVELFDIKDFHQPVLSFDWLIIGSSIRYGKHHLLIEKFMTQKQSDLRLIQTGFFSVNLVARKPDKSLPSNNPYLLKFIDRLGWRPDILDVFAGMLDYHRYSFFDRWMIRLIMKMTHGPTHTERPIEYTDWKRVNEFGQKMIQVIEQKNESMIDHIKII